MDSSESDFQVANGCLNDNQPHNDLKDEISSVDEKPNTSATSQSLDPRMNGVSHKTMSYLENSENILNLEDDDFVSVMGSEINMGIDGLETESAVPIEKDVEVQDDVQVEDTAHGDNDGMTSARTLSSGTLPEPEVVSKEIDTSGETKLDIDETNLSIPQGTPFSYNAHFEGIFDDENYFPSLKHNVNEIVKFDDINGDLINHANIKALIVQLTSPDIIDYNLIYDFFITYRMFVDSETVMNYLMVRLIWSLQYLNREDDQSKRIGQLVLLRTFVVLRHWILNYFVDDFNSNLKLCDIFIQNLNSIVFESNLVNSSMVFETKILKDLKNHWISSVKEFWNVELEIADVLTFKLPLTAELTVKTIKKSSTEMSIHTNPSYRRSAMLSLYDNKTHHKCLVFDELKFKTENPQLSINNLLVSHKSSRQSIMNKLNNFNLKSKNGSGRNSVSAGSGIIPTPTSPSNVLNNSTNRMNLNDSSVGLKKTQRVVTEKKGDQISLNPVQIENMGFATNGNIKLPSPKVLNIVPLTPAKKMEYVIRPDCGFEVSDWDDPINSKLLNNVEFNRKKSIKKILESWKKSSKHNDRSSEEINDLINQSISEDVIGNRVDILSARIIDELEFLIRNYIQTDSHNTIIEADTIDNSTNDHIDIDDFDNSIDLSGSPAKKYTMSGHHQSSASMSKEDSMNEVDINDLSELNMNKIDNIINDQEERDDVHEFSFQRPTSINWNDVTGLELETSRKEEEEEDSYGQEAEQVQAQVQELREQNSDLPEPNLPRDGSNKSLAEPHFAFSNNNGSRMSSLSTPSNFTDYNAEIEDLGIAVSPKSKNQQMKRISFTSGTGKRFSRSSSNSLFKRDSVKSYVSYDSAFSVSRESINETGNLRKKAGVNNLRTLAGLPAERKSFESTRIHSTSSVRKSIRTSTVLALSELPFNGYYESKSSVNLGGNKVYRNSGIGDSSVFSVAMKSRTSVANSFQTLNESADQTNDSDEFAFGFRAPSEDNDSLKHSIAIPGISNNVLKELAAIPDESFHFNPIDFALNKLEGVKKEHHIYNDELNTSETTHVDDTQDILNEINNANTEDIIETSSQNYTEDRPMTPLKQLDQEVDTSTPTQQNVLNNTVGTLESQDDANIDNVFIFSANYSNGTEVIRSHGQSQSDSPVYQSPRLILQNYNLHDGLGIESTMSNDKHISFILSYSSTELTDHFTLIERDILQEIDWKDLIELKWNKELTPVNSWLEIIVNDDYFNSNRGVNLVIARFNLMVNWIISEILLTKNLHERVQIFSRFIHIANNCLANQNYSTLMQILLALTSEKISKLKQTWKELPPGDILILKNLEELSSPIKNFLNLRVSINKIQPSRGCVPFVGLYLSDLIFNTERPKFINKTKGLVNFARFRTSVHIVKSLSQCIEWSSYYNLTVNNELLSKCLYIRSLNEDEMNFCLSKIIDP